MAQCDSKPLNVASCSVVEETGTTKARAPPPPFVVRDYWPPCIADKDVFLTITLDVIRVVMSSFKTLGTPTQAAVLDQVLSSLRFLDVPVNPFFRHIDMAGLQAAIEAEPVLGVLADDLFEDLLARKSDNYQSWLRMLVRCFYDYDSDGNSQPCDEGDSSNSGSSRSTLDAPNGNDHDDFQNTLISSTSTGPNCSSPSRQDDGRDDVPPVLDAPSLPFKNLRHRYKLEETLQWADFAFPVFYLCSQVVGTDDSLEHLVQVVQGILSHLPDPAQNRDSETQISASSFDGLTARQLYVILERDAAFTQAVRHLVSVSRAGMASQKHIDDFRQALRPVVNHRE